MSDIIFLSDNIEVFFRPGHSSYAMIAFGPATQLANGRSFWAQSVAERADICAVGIMGRRANWFPRQDIEEARDKIRSHLSQYNQVIGYGSSMGGYAVLKYGKLLGITHGLSFAPQWSISPYEVASWDKRFFHVFSKRLHDGMAIAEGDAPESCVVYYDPFFEEDKLNFVKIQNRAPAIMEVRAYLTGHYPISLVRGTENALGMFNLLLSGDLDGIRKAATAARRDPILALRAPFVADLISRKNPDGALRMHAKYRERFDPGHSFLLYHKLTGVFMELGRYEDAVRCSEICLAAGEMARDPFIRRSMLEEKRGNIAAAYHYAREAVQRWPTTTTKMHLASLMVNDKKASDAALLLQTILDNEPENLPAIRLMLRLAHERKDVKACDALIERLLSVDNSADTCARIGNIYFDRNSMDLAEEFYQRAVSVDPEYGHGWQLLTNFYLKLPSWRKAIEAAECYIRCYPNSPDGYRYLAQAYKGIGFSNKRVLAEAEANKRAQKITTSSSSTPSKPRKDVTSSTDLRSSGSAYKSALSRVLSRFNPKRLSQ